MYYITISLDILYIYIHISIMDRFSQGLVTTSVSSASWHRNLAKTIALGSQRSNNLKLKLPKRYVSMYVCTYIYICMYKCVYTYIYIYMYIYIYIYIYICIYKYTYVNTCVNIYICMYIYIYIFIYLK